MNSSTISLVGGELLGDGGELELEVGVVGLGG